MNEEQTETQNASDADPTQAVVLKLPDWWPDNPYPEELFPMTTAQYVKYIPDTFLRTAISGFLGRVAWEIASQSIFEALGKHEEYIKGAAVETPFPFNEVPSRFHKRNHWLVTIPRTVEDLLRIGRFAIAHGDATRNIGDTTLVEVDSVMRKFGFEDRWMSS